MVITTRYKPGMKKLILRESGDPVDIEAVFVTVTGEGKMDKVVEYTIKNLSTLQKDDVDEAEIGVSQ